MSDDSRDMPEGSGWTYTLPPGLDLPGEQPFWVAVAWWGWQLGRPFGYQEVATAFCVSPGVARNVINYILALPEEALLCSRHYLPVRGRVRCRLLEVVSPPSLMARARNRQMAGRRRCTAGREMVDAVIAVLRARETGKNDGTEADGDGTFSGDPTPEDNE